MTPAESDDHGAAARRDGDDALLAELNAPPSVEEARESHLFWDQRRAKLPVHRRVARREAEQMAERWRIRLVEAERERRGLGLVEQVMTLLGIRRPPRLPSVRRMVWGLGLAAVVIMLVLIALAVAVVAFWPELQPVVRRLVGGGAAGEG